MGIKEILFTIFLIGAISIPFFFKQKGINLSNKINLANIEIKEGNFKKLSLKLEENGTFSKIDYINNNNYTIYNLIINMVEKNSTLISKKVHFNGLYHFYNISYKTKNYVYNATTAIYNPKTKIATSNEFSFFNEKINGKGKEMVYKNDIITAHNIDYIIKGFK